MVKVNIIGVAGGSCSGKTSFANKIVDALGPEQSAILFQDNYYIDQSSRFDKDGGAVNFDHPQSIDFELLHLQLQKLKQGEAIEIPLYDFVTHTRKTETLNFAPKPIVILDGTLIFTRSDIMQTMSLSLFIECNKEMRFNRRLQRDVEERGRTPEGVKIQFDEHVEPMHEKYVEPSKLNAHHCISQQEYADNSTDLIEKLILPVLD